MFTNKLPLTLLLLVFAVPATAAAQTPAGPTSLVQWAQAVLSGQTLAGYTHLAKVDAGAPTVMTRTCSAQPGPNGFVCTSPLPAMTPGTHTLRVISRYTSGSETFEAAENPAADRVAMTLIVVVGATGVTIVSASPQP